MTGFKNWSAIALGKIGISAVYKGTILVWQGVKSCFGQGRWANEKPWSDEEPWKNDTKLS